MQKTTLIEREMFLFHDLPMILRNPNLIAYSRLLMTMEWSVIIKQLNITRSIIILNALFAVSSPFVSIDVVALKSSPVNKVSHSRFS